VRIGDRWLQGESGLLVAGALRREPPALQRHPLG
jgi:hypothetical protein